MIGIVIVSHSKKAAEGICELALQMADPQLRILTAAGMPDGSLGTDPIHIQQAVEAADSGDGVLVFADLGSAVLNIDFAFELLSPELRQRVCLADAPLLEGVVLGAIEASVPQATLQKVLETAETTRELQKRL